MHAPRLDKLREKVELVVHRARNLLPADRWQPSSIVDNILINLSPVSTSRWLYDIKPWLRWAESNSCATSSLTWIRGFAEHYTSEKLKPETLRKWFWALGALFDAAGFREGDERTLMRQLPREYGLRRERFHRRPRLFQRAHLERLLACVRRDHPRELRDAALFVILHETMVSPADILGRKIDGDWLLPPVQLSDVSRSRDGSGRILLTTNGYGRTAGRVNVPLSAWAMRWVADWIDASGRASGALIPSLQKTDESLETGESLTEPTARKRFRKLARRAGFNDRQFTLRSFCLGTINDLLAVGMHPDAVRRAARYLRLETIIRYQMASNPREPRKELAAHYARTLRPHVQSPSREPQAEVQLTFSF